jgi:hypothetical protein
MAASASCCQDNSFHSSSMIVVNVHPGFRADHSMQPVDGGCLPDSSPGHRLARFRRTPMQKKLVSILLPP